MTTPSDFDRLLSDWLEDGPTLAPDRPIDEAIAHARSHPRGRNAFASLRSDPMAVRTTVSAGPALLLAVVGLLLVSVAVLVVGSPRIDPPIVPPIVSPSPTVMPTTVPRPDFSVDLLATVGTDASVSVADESGRLTRIESGPAAEPSGIRDIVVSNDEPNILRLAWQSGCESRSWLTIDASARQWTLEHPICQGDAIGGPHRSLILTFAEPIDARDVQATIVEGVGVNLPNFQALGPDSAGNAFSIDVDDDSRLVTLVESSSEGGGGASVESGQVKVENVAENVIRFIWASGPCHTSVHVSIGPSARQVVISEPPCQGDDAVYDRRIDLTFSQPVSATDVQAAYQEDSGAN